MRCLAVVIGLASVAQAGPPTTLGSDGLIVPDAVHVAAMGDLALAAWNLGPTTGMTIKTALLSRDGGVAVVPMPQLGNFARYSLRVSANGAERVFLVVWPDWGSGGQTGASRVTPEGVALDGYGEPLSTASYTGRVRVASRAGGFRLLETSGVGVGMVELVPASGPLQAQSATLHPEINSDLFDVATVEDAGVWCWADDGGVACRSEVASPTWLPLGVVADLALSAHGALLDVVSLDSSGGLVVTTLRANGQVVDGPRTWATSVTVMGAAANEARTWLAWADLQGRAFVQPLGGAATALTPSAAPLAAIQVAPLSEGSGLGWVIASVPVGDGGFVPELCLVDVHDAGPVPMPDAGQTMDAGVDGGVGAVTDSGVSLDGGAGLPPDAGPSDAGGQLDAGTDASRRRLSVGCSSIEGALVACAASWLVRRRRRAVTRPTRP